MALIVQPSAEGVKGLRITIVGLGLMGGSIARALKRGAGAIVTAVDRDAKLTALALAQGVIDRGCDKPAQALADADLTVLCLYPEASIRFMKEHMACFAPGSVVTDICGVKQKVINGLVPILRSDIDFVPGHPMAGRERAGYQYSDEALFDRCNYILTPLQQNKEESIELVKRFAGALGAGAVVLAEPAEHDEMIAYTSQLPHALAVAYVLATGRRGDGQPLQRNPLPFSAGSYRDVSRVAAINAPMWAELFLENRDALLGELDGLKAGLEHIEQYIRDGDGQSLIEYMSAAARAREVLK
jgi:prephenate dehydrogenase